MEKSGCKIICGAPTTLTVKGLMMMMMMHHNTKFSNKMFGILEDILWKNIDVLTLLYDLDLEVSTPFFFTRHSSL